MTQKSEIVYVEAKKNSYAEAHQSIQARMTFLHKDGETYTELFAPVMCRDFLNTVLHLEYWNLPRSSVCGFSYDATQTRIDRDQIRLSLQCHSQSAFENMQSNLLGILHPIESANGFALTTVKQPNDKILILGGDPRWLSSTITLSTYTLLARMSGLSFSDLGNWQTHVVSRHANTSDWKFFDGSMSNVFPPLLGKLAQVSKLFEGKPPAGWQANAPIGDVHFYSGLIQGLTGTHNPHIKKILKPLLKAA